ncbi:MAG: hypothetical protein IJ027_00880 [Oscillospiraceae bacterium]|nr:hypothetical protein [Oscillospiraceae bacterium]
MSEYKEPYLIMFRQVTRAIESIDKGYYFGARQVLVEAQIAAEEAYVDYFEKPKKKNKKTAVK